MSKSKTGMEILLAEQLGEIYKIDEALKKLPDDMAAIVNEAHKIRIEIAEAFSEAEKSISEMNTQVEESIKKHGDKAAATLGEKTGERLNSMLNQMTVHQLDSLNKIQAFFDSTAKKLAPELDDEINKSKQKALKEIAVLVDRINGDKLVSKLVTYAIIFSITSSLITVSLNYILNQYQYNQCQTTPSAALVKRH